ncbi:PBP1A family penicillin-binding protein [Chryseomicrobium palamuruense]|uniref:PBP1A family penicillin-binding protein n=1 Tax=Chryseomicrobium palamuruense TaxID=682973 RepID=A0ABV8UTK6_9BACL
MELVANEQRSRQQRRLEQQKAKQKGKKKVAKGGMVKKIFLALVAIGLIGLLSGLGLFVYYASSAPELDEASLKDPISSTFLDKNGEPFYKSGTENRIYVNYTDIPQQMEDAILATEDVRFYDHMGMDFLRLGSAVLANVTQGFGAQGASTITQQVVKNSFLQNEKTLKRKAQEAWLAFQLERQYEKEEIFEMYFNKILMSGRNYGFGTASEYFYGKELNELELHEMAMLAGIPQSPNNYNPFTNPELAEKRRNTVLHLMEMHGKITAEEEEAAKAVPVTETLIPEEERQASSVTRYEAFIDIVESELNKIDPSLLSEGITVHTTLDPGIQSKVENVINSGLYATEKQQAGIAVVDPKSGALVAAGGARNYSNRGWNYAYDNKDRQPGSTMKPLLAYGPAVENLNWSTGHTVVDEEITYSNSDQVVRNFSGRYLGVMTMREALYRSQNTPAVKTLQEVGLSNSRDFINRFGFNVENVYESSVLGGIEGISPIMLAGAYGAFANGGYHAEPFAINKIVYRDGQTEDVLKNELEPVMKDSTAYMVTDMLRDVLENENGTGRTAAVPGIDLAGKTGTSNYSEDEYAKYDLPSGAFPDTWFAGYSTDYSVAIWSGNAKRSEPMTSSEERRVPQLMFKEIMSTISANAGTFSRPNSVVEATIEVGTSPLQLASAYTPNNLKRTELFVRGSEPTAVSEEFELTELPAPTGLSADYDESSASATLSWGYEAPEGVEDEIEFTVTARVNDGGSQELDTTTQLGLIVQDLQPGNTYTFSVVASADGITSSPATVSITIAQEEEEEPVEEEPTEENPENQPGQGNGNGGSNGNGNGNGDGESGGSEDSTDNPDESTEPDEPTEPDPGSEDSDTDSTDGQ